MVRLGIDWHSSAFFVPGGKICHSTHKVVQVVAFVLRVQTLQSHVEILSSLGIQLYFLLSCHGCKGFIDEGEALLALQYSGLVLVPIGVQIAQAALLLGSEAWVCR